MSLDEEKNPYKPFQPHPVEPHYGRDRGFVVSHTKLDLHLDERARTVEGTSTLDLQAIVRLDDIELDAEDLEIKEIRLDGVKVPFTTEKKKLTINPRKPLKEGEKARVAIRYSARPRRGLYFVKPDKHYPRKPWQIWSQGESEDNHCWFPGYDYPNNKATSEVILTVRKGLTAVSNGHLIGSTPLKGGKVRWHWRQDVAQPNYLIAVVVGSFDEIKDDWDGVPLTYLVPKGQAAWGRETFKHTPDILKFFSKATAYRYPYPKYAQAVIADFMWGGMENTSMTTVNERFLIGPEHRDDANPDGLIAHEAAHQWFGDLVTTKSWEHIWLNEGFATYFDALFHEDFYGPDVFQQEMRDNAETYFDEEKDHYRRPLVTRHFQENEDVFDRHTYQKGSLVLHMLRHELGDDLWWKTIRHYVKKHEWKNVETNDLKVAIEEATGRNLDWFFDQWMYKAGHPELEASVHYDKKAKQVRLTIKQTQKVVGDTPRFRFDVDVWVWASPERKARHTVRVSKEEESFFFPAATKPKLVQFDPEGALLKKLKFERDAEEWVFQLEHCPTSAGRTEAAEGLGKKANDPKATPALEKALTSDKFWGVRMAAASALGDQETTEAREALGKNLTDKHPRVRRAVAGALGHFLDDAQAVRWLLRLISKDRSDYVVATSIHSLAKLRSPQAAVAIRKNLHRKSHNDVIASSCLLSLAEIKDEKSLPVLQDSSRYGRPQYVRSAATHAMARIWEFVEKKGQDEIRITLSKLLHDPLHHQRRSTLSSLATVPDAKLRARLEDAVDAEPIGLVRRVARESLRQNTEKAGQQARIGDLKKDLDDLKQENRKLKASVAEIEKKLARRR